MTDPINADGSAAESIPEALQRVTFHESPLDEKFAVRVEPERVVNTRSWARRGVWKYRQFGHEIQMRCVELPGVQLDMFRSEAEALHELLGEMLGRPAPLPLRVPPWTRLKQWWLRAVWKRKHYAELDAWRASVVEDFTRRGPWG
jgi:hypothetical protein